MSPILRRRAGLETVVLDGEAVVFDSETSRVHRLNATATAVWSRLDAATDLPTLVRGLGAGQAASVAAFVDELAQMGLLE